jgi:cell division protein FtsB
MSNIAKMFVFLNLVLSIVYIGIAGTLLAQRVDYKEAIRTQKKDFERDQAKKDSVISELNSQKTDLEQELGSLKTKNQVLEKENNDYVEQISAVTGRYNELDKKLGSLEDNYEKLTQETQEKDQANKQLRKDNEELRAKADDAEGEKEQALDDKARLEEELSQSQNMVSSIEKELKKSKKELEESRILIDSARNAGVDFQALYRPERPIDGKVMVVSREVNLVAISVGADDGVEKGYHFTVFRGSLYVGQLIVENVSKDMSSARIKLETVAEGQQVLEGDNVSTRIR